jgi:plastocyanin
MRFPCVLLLVGAASVASPGLTPGPARACDPVFYRGGFYPAGRVSYAQPYTYARPFTYAQSYAYAQPSTPTYAAPSMYYAPRASHAPSVSYQQSSGYGASPAPSAAPAPQPTSPTTSAAVGLYENRFEPATLTVAPGTTVRWTNHGQHKHTVTSAAEKWDSGDLGPGQVYSATFSQPGTYEYHCRHHKEMRGTIIVK